MSQFASLFKTDAKEKTETKVETKPTARKEKKKTVASPVATVTTPTAATAEKRATGKSSNPDYTQFLSYIRRDTHNRVKAALIFDEKKRDLSDLVEELLSDWVKKNFK